MAHLESHETINGTQHDFRKGGSCLSNLLQFLDQVTRSIEEDECVDVIYLDFAKAFDKVPCGRLMEKLDKHGIGGRFRDWVKEWLRDRSQRVCKRMLFRLETCDKWSVSRLSLRPNSVLDIY